MNLLIFTSMYSKLCKLNKQLMNLGLLICQVFKRVKNSNFRFTYHPYIAPNLSIRPNWYWKSNRSDKL